MKNKSKSLLGKLVWSGNPAKFLKRTVTLLVCGILLGFMYTSCSDDPPTSPTVTEPENNEQQAKLPLLRVDGRYLKNPEGEIVNLHGTWRTPQPWFNGEGKNWNNWDVNGCLSYNKKMLDKVLAAGWKLDFVRIHMDQYWSDDPNSTSALTYQRFDETRFRKYLDEVYVPMAEYAISKGLYVVLLPGISCPHDIEVGDGTNQLLIKYWDIVSKHPKIKNNHDIMFELINEPVDIKGTDGTIGASNQGHFDALKEYLQVVVDTIRVNTGNIIWVPGLGYESNFWGFANNPIEGDNIGYSVHLYPGWMDSDGENGDGGLSSGGYEAFQRGWDRQVKPVADFAPILITEMDWAPSKYQASWGKSITGTVGGEGFGANFKYIVDNSDNVSWLFFTGWELIANFVNEPGEPGNYTVLNDPEACIWQCYHWFNEYAGVGKPEGQMVDLVIKNVDEANITMLTGSSKSLLVKAIYADGSEGFVSSKAEFSSSAPASVSIADKRLTALKDGSATVTVAYTDAHGNREQITLSVTSTTFPLTNSLFNPSLFQTGSFDEDTKTLITGQWGTGGWHYNKGVDISGYKYVVAEIGNDNTAGTQFRLWDENNFWSQAVEAEFGNSRRVVIDLHNVNKKDTTVKLNPAHIYYAGFWTYGNTPLIINRVYLTNTYPN